MPFRRRHHGIQTLARRPHREVGVVILLHDQGSASDPR
jgi:hypothetical protein